MEKCKLERLTFEELAEVMPIVTKKEQEESCGGGNGSSSNPYSWGEYECFLMKQYWHGGYVEGMGYVLPEVVVTPSTSAANRARIADRANSHVGLHGSNWAAVQILIEYGVRGSHPNYVKWCAGYASYVYASEGFLGVGAGDLTVDWWKNFGNLTTNPQIGDIAIWPTGTSHMGIVTGVNGDYITVTSGNYSNAVGQCTYHKSYFGSFRSL